MAETFLAAGFLAWMIDEKKFNEILVPLVNSKQHLPWTLFLNSFCLIFFMRSPNLD